MIWVEILAGVVIWLTFGSLIPRVEWWFRGADFPRLQILVLGLIAFGLLLFWDQPWDIAREIICIALIAALAYQLKMVLPYTFIWKKQVKQVILSRNAKAHIRRLNSLRLNSSSVN